jgi:predicted ATP-dependent protease
MVFPAVNIKDVGDIPADVRERIELVPVENMDEVFAFALSRVIVPQRMRGRFVIEVEDDEEIEVEIEDDDEAAGA